jgi:hypothetical protein
LRTEDLVRCCCGVAAISVRNDSGATAVMNQRSRVQPTGYMQRRRGRAPTAPKALADEAALASPSRHPKPGQSRVVLRELEPGRRPDGAQERSWNGTDGEKTGRGCRRSGTRRARNVPGTFLERNSERNWPGCAASGASGAGFAVASQWLRSGLASQWLRSGFGAARPVHGSTCRRSVKERAAGEGRTRRVLSLRDGRRGAERAQRTAHSAQRTAHSAQRTAHRAQRTAHSAQRTAHSAQRTAHSGRCA